MSTTLPSVQIAHLSASTTPFKTLMQAAEALFGPKAGAAKKKWVTEQIIALADTINIPAIPAGLEHTIKVALIGAIIEMVWGLVFKAS